MKLNCEIFRHAAVRSLIVVLLLAEKQQKLILLLLLIKFRSMQIFLFLLVPMMVSQVFKLNIAVGVLNIIFLYLQDTIRLGIQKMVLGLFRAFVLN